MLPPSDGLTLQMWRMEHICPRTDSLHLQVPKLTVTRKNSPDVETWAPPLYLPTFCWATTRLFAFQRKCGLKSPLQYPNARSDVYDISPKWSKCRCFFKKMHARVISDSKPFFIITCFLSFWRCLSYDDSIFRMFLLLKNKWLVKKCRFVLYFLHFGN